jgi:acyl dehydratase
MAAWERSVRDWMGLEGTLRSIRGFRMRSFNVVGDTTTVVAEVAGKREEGDLGIVEISIRCENSSGVTVGPGTVEVTLPRRRGTTA